jgi:hypothetical protein
MAIPYTFARVKPQDVTLTPFPVYKRYSVSSSQLTTTSSGFSLTNAVHTSLKTPIGSNKATNDPTNSIDGSYQHIMWHYANKLWYKFAYDSESTLEHANRRYTFKFLNYSASILAIPYFEYGESIKPRSVSITNNTDGFRIIDDPNGNLYDPSIVTSSYAKPHYVVGYWGFNDIFKKFKYRDGHITYGSTGFVSRTFEPDDHTYISNVGFTRGVEINGSPSGMGADFSGTSYMMTHDRPEFNFPTDENFTISTWVRIPVSQSVLNNDTNAIISKRGVIRKLVYGLEEKYTKSDSIVTSMHVSTSIADEHTDVYPYDLDVYNTGASNGKIRFRRSNGIQTLSLVSTSSLNDGRYHHVAVVKNDSTLYLYVDGQVHSSGSELMDHPINNHALMFGAVNRASYQGFSGSLDEIRIYEYAVDSAGIQTLSDNISGSLYQNAIVGNVFYRSGHIVISPLNPKYKNALSGNYTLSYRGTHTIYQYEILCRIKAGSFNLTYNPTARRSPKSDLLINDMTGSSTLLPYFTEVGLYNSSGILVAVAKMGSAVQMRDDVDLNVIIRMDC